MKRYWWVWAILVVGFVGGFAVKNTFARTPTLEERIGEYDYLILVRRGNAPYPSDVGKPQWVQVKWVDHSRRVIWVEFVKGEEER